jgi:hypothetical protein
MDCEWQYVEHARLTGEDTLVMRDNSPDDCKALCLAEKSFSCVSFDYDFVNRICYLSIRNRYSGAITTGQATFDYYELNRLGRLTSSQY